MLAKVQPSFRIFVGLGTQVIASLVAVFIASIGVDSQAGILLDGNTESQYIDYANQPQFAASGTLTGGPGPGSATLIAPHWVLSAGHVGNATTFQIGGTGTAYAVSLVIPHPQFVLNGSNLGYGFDIALYRLSAPVVGVTPANIYRGSNEDILEGSITGFGVSGFGSSTTAGSPPSLGAAKRAGTNDIDLILSFSNGPSGQVGAQNAALLSDFDAPIGFGTPGQYNSLATFGSSPLPSSLEYHLANQDSGGGTYVFEGGQWLLAGINSGVVSQQGIYDAFGIPLSGSTQNFGYGAGSLFTRVSSYQTFIDSNVNAVPEPSSIAMLSMVSVLAAFKRNSRRPIANPS
ncbi:MAG: trypsin-like serine protease [Pirellulaceae bacterium]|nr:trypsin-like serine protease [Pirellulaceae bacterium]